MGSRLVDLFTHSKSLQDLILSEYGWEEKKTLYPEQHKVDTSETPHLFCFYDLDYISLEKLLKNRNYEYEIRDSKTGEIVEEHSQIPDNLTN